MHVDTRSLPLFHSDDNSMAIFSKRHGISSLRDRSDTNNDKLLIS